MSSLSPGHVLQPARWTNKTREGAVSAGDLRCDDDVISGLAGESVRLDGIFGAFFDGYWARYTGIEDLALRFSLTGCIEIEIERMDSRTGRTEPVVRAVYRENDAPVVIPVPLTDGGETRLSLSVRLISDSSLSGMAWTTSTPPLRSVRLTGVICTFNRDADVAATVSELLGHDSGLHRLLVVNQGVPGLIGRIGHSASEILTIIDQANLGGAGGFGRGMLEALSDDECSHILVMDDDIDLDARIVSRVIPVLSYLRSDHVLGGAMLDRSRRTRIFSVGDVLHHSRPEIRNLVEIGADDITSDATSRYLARHHQPDFNGWWFCCLPKAQVENVGLPLPLFIRGDDVEYGFRLTSSGTKTLAWPGLAVWHEPFHNKRHPWHYFYDRRNSLFLCEMHRRFGRFRLCGFLITGFINHVLRFDYDRANCIALGLRAFNDGAEGLKRWNGSDHARLVADFSSGERPAEPGCAGEAFAESAVPKPFLLASRLVHDLAAGAPGPGRPVTVAARHWRPAISRRPTHVRILYEDSGTVAEFRHDPARTRACAKLFSIEMMRFLRRRWRPDQLRTLCKRDFWMSYTSGFMDSWRS